MKAMQRGVALGLALLGLTCVAVTVMRGSVASGPPEARL
jgi:hypothetical protein